MPRQRRSFSPEFKHEAASLVVNQGYSVSEASRSLGVGANDVRRWVRQLGEERRGVIPPFVTALKSRFRPQGPTSVWG